MSAVAWLLLLPLSAPPGDAFAEKTEVRIRLINALSGKPYVGRFAGLFGTNSTGPGLHGKEILFHLETKTGADGVAHFLIAEPLPLRLILDIRLNRGCAWHGAPPVITSEVLKSGYVGPNECARKNQSFHWQDVKAEPGEIVLFVVEPPGGLFG
jgi:hypothetical protein